MKKMIQAQDFIDQNRTTVQIFVIDKRQEKPSPSNMPKAVYEQMPKSAKIRKTNLVRAKVGPQIVTLMCDKPVYQVLPVKKNVKVDLGVYCRHHRDESGGQEEKDTLWKGGYQRKQNHEKAEWKSEKVRNTPLPFEEGVLFLAVSCRG